MAAAPPKRLRQKSGRQTPDARRAAEQFLLARALYRESRVIVLDEATSLLDPAGEAAVFRRLKQIAAVRSVIVISHRAAAAAYADAAVQVPDLTEKNENRA